MTIIISKSPTQFNIEKVLWADKDAVRAFVRAAMVSQTEAHVDMLIDCAGMYPDRASIQDSLKNVKGGASVLLSDLMDELKASVLREAETVLYGAIVTGLKFDLEGDYKDIEVDISVNWE